MDYGRLSMFMVGATAAMAIATHLWCWAYTAVSRMSIYWRLDRLRKQLSIDDIEEEAIERRRALAPRYMTWEQAMEDFRGGMPLDDVLDRLDGKFPPKAADIQKGAPGDPSFISGQALATVICQIALVTYLFGFTSPTPEMIEVLLKNAKGNSPEPLKTGPAGIEGAIGPSGPNGGSGIKGADGA